MIAFLGLGRPAEGILGLQLHADGRLGNGTRWNATAAAQQVACD
jgi:hypothetical protein